MPPDSDGVRMVGCSLERLVPNPDHLHKIQEAVSATHKATILATEFISENAWLKIQAKISATYSTDHGS